MEKLFNISILDELYEAKKSDFEDKIVQDKDRKIEYRKIIDKQEKITEKLTELISKYVKEPDQQEEISSNIRLLDNVLYEEQAFWNKNYYKLGVGDGIRIEKEFGKNAEIQK